MTDRELDAKVAEVVMGWSAVEYDAGDARTMGVCHGTPPGPKSDHIADLSLHGTGTGSYHIPRYSTTGDGMLAVVEAMRGRGWSMQANTSPAQTPVVWFSKVDHTKALTDAAHYQGQAVADADTLPRAVSLAALRAVGK